ncbi:MAG: type III-A CRISPR-associated RAMP protein Csm3 [Bacteroidales bacterium]|nr:type III-A CRISPR-associated RAMP protein Csm3 [Bacteroidales bacterium]
MKLVRKLVYSGEIKLKTGLHIGGTNTTLGIGGIDKLVVRNPLSKKPYIPGSSLKGKLRSLIEIKDGTVSRKETDSGISYGPFDEQTKRAGWLFGTSPKDAQDKKSRPSRLIVRDCELITEGEDFKNCDLLYTESKTEVSIDRVTAQANPRTFERVPAGARFKLEMIVNIFQEDGETDEIVEKKEKELRKTLKDAAELLQDDYLGGQGSRGYGQIEFIKVDFDKPAIKEYK